MADTGALSVGTGASVDPGTNPAWSGATSIYTSNNAYAVCSLSSGTPSDHTVSLTKDAATPVGGNKSTGAALPTTEAYRSYGESDDLWGTTWTPAEINSANFGVIYRAAAGTISEYLIGTNIGASIPNDATIDGIVVEIEQLRAGSLAAVDHIRITVYYTEAGGGGGVASTPSLMQPRTKQRRISTLLRM